METKHPSKSMNFAYSIFVGVLIATTAMTALTISFFSYRWFGATGLMSMIAVLTGLSIVVGIAGYKRRHVSLFGRVIRGEPIE